MCLAALCSISDAGTMANGLLSALLPSSVSAPCVVTWLTLVGLRRTAARLNVAVALLLLNLISDMLRGMCYFTCCSLPSRGVVMVLMEM